MVSPQRPTIPVGDHEGFELRPVERADDGRHQIAGVALRDDLREVVFHGQHQLAQDEEHAPGIVEVVVDLTPWGQVLDVALAFQGHVARRLLRDAGLDIPWRIRQAANNRNAQINAILTPGQRTEFEQIERERREAYRNRERDKEKRSREKSSTNSSVKPPC